MVHMSIDKDAAMYRNLNEKLRKYDWFVSPYYSQLQLGPLFELLDNQPEPTNRHDKEKFGRIIADHLIKANLGPHFRACIIFESYRVAPHVNKFSHLVEAGLFEFYKLNLITCLAVWVPTIEGILRSLLKIRPGKRLRFDGLTSLTAKNDKLNSFLDSITETIVDLLKSSFFLRSKNDQFPPANRFSRHFISHLLSEEPFYCRSNCLRLLNIIDSLLMIDLINSGSYRAFFEGKSDRVKERERYYSFLLNSAFADAEMNRAKLLEDHPFFDKDYFMA